VVVDYAHTPDALEKTLGVLRPFCSGRLSVVFGCGGDRDRGKRPIMGRLAEQLADRVYVTSDNPRTEPPEQILTEITQGMAKPGAAAKVADRAAAIGRAIAEAKAGDMVLIAGKGHETYQILGTKTVAFDDREVARACLSR
jgi:UDP-N-acetylmuramoyl-L-alanyl-D-glutamate--2,6-diaminopimelate ligase